MEKIINTPQQDTNPGIELLERNDSPANPIRSCSLSGFEIITEPEKIRKGEQDKILEKARSSLLNEKIYKNFIQAVADKNQGSVKKFAQIENKFLENCINLRDEQTIDEVVSSFNRAVIEYTQSQQGSVGWKTLQDISAGRFNIKSEGIKSVIKYIRNRVKLFSLDPKQQYDFYINEDLDASWSIDLVEIVFNPEGDISQLGLVQVKTSLPTAEEIEKIQNDHQSWVKERALSEKEMKSVYTGNSENELSFEKMLENEKEFYENFFDICADETISHNSILRELGVENLTKPEQAWLIHTHMSNLNILLKNMVDEGYIDNEHSQSINKSLLNLHDSLVKKTHLPENIIKIKSAKSIISVGAKIISEKALLKDDKGELIAKKVDKKQN